MITKSNIFIIVLYTYLCIAKLSMCTLILVTVRKKNMVLSGTFFQQFLTVAINYCINGDSK